MGAGGPYHRYLELIVFFILPTYGKGARKKPSAARIHGAGLQLPCLESLSDAPQPVFTNRRRFRPPPLTRVDPHTIKRGPSMSPHFLA